MKWMLFLAGGVTLLFAWLALRAPSDAPQAAGPPVHAAAPPAAAPAPAVRLAAAEAPRPSGILLFGVLYRGAGDPGSQALLGVAGRPAQAFRVGDMVAQGWSLSSVAADHVMLAFGSALARLDITQSAQAQPLRTAAQPVPVALPVNAREAPLPGFVPHAPGTAAAPRAPGPANLATNRKFLEDMQKHRAAAR